MHNACDLIIEDAKDLLLGFRSHKFSHTCRSGNSVAHALARRALDIHNCLVWMEDVPPNIVHVLLNDFHAL